MIAAMPNAAVIDPVREPVMIPDARASP